MQSLKVFPVLLLLLWAFSSFSDVKETKWVVGDGGSLRVGGSTNVNKFSCTIAKYTTPDTLLIVISSSGSVKMSGSLSLDIQNFDCHNGIMTKDLQKTLKVKEFPLMRIRFLSLDRYPKPGQVDAIKGKVSIELAGVTRPYEVEYHFSSSGPKALSFTGIRQVTFSDFNLVPPRKIGGMIKTKNELAVEFTLNVTRL